MIPMAPGFFRPFGSGAVPSYSEWYHAIDYITFESYPGSGGDVENLTLKRAWAGLRTGGPFVDSSVAKFGSKSLYLDGVTGTLFNTTEENNDAIEIKATEPLTAEFFFRPDSSSESVDDQLLEIFGSGNGHGLRIRFLHSASPKVWRVSMNNGSGWTDWDSGTFDWSSIHLQWTHLAFVKEGTDANLYINGVSVISISGYTMPVHEEHRTYVGGTADGDLCFKGWIDDIFITKLKLYTGNFAPRTGQYVPVQTVDKILFPLDTDLIDVYGVATGSGGSISTSYSKWGTGSLDRTGSHTGFIMPKVALMDMYNKEFCVEFWYRPNSLPPNAEAYHGLFSFAGSNITFIPMYININNTQINANHYMEFPQNQYGVGEGAHGMTAGNWYHIAYVRGPTKHSLYVNGTRIGTGGSVYRGSKISYSTFPTGDARLGIFPSGFYPCDGHFNDFRWTIGTSVYDATQSTITVPSGPLT